MLKFVNKDGKLRYILLDTSNEVYDVDKLSKEDLERLGIILEENDIEKTPKPSGISQNDTKYLKGDK